MAKLPDVIVEQLTYLYGTVEGKVNGITPLLLTWLPVDWLRTMRSDSASDQWTVWFLGMLFMILSSAAY